MVLRKVKATIRKHNLIKKGDKIVVGVSGGPDSLTLLFILNALRKELRFNIHIAHLDHMLRRDSYKDKQFVETLANKLRLPITASQINVRELLKKGSVEEIARRIRLGFLFKVAKDISANKIALGHTQDDQAETVLMRILRGVGLYGLSGILPRRDIKGFTIIRPLIDTQREEIESYLRRRKIKPLIDSSNLKDIYFRNRIRNNLLPLLEKRYNPNIKRILANMAEILGTDYDYLLGISEKKVKLNKSSRGIKIKLDDLLKLHPSIQRLIIRLGLSRIKGDTRRFTFQHMKEIEDLVYNRPVNSVVDLPGDVSVIKKKKHLSVYKRNKKNTITA